MPSSKSQAPVRSFTGQSTVMTDQAAELRRTADLLFGLPDAAAAEYGAALREQARRCDAAAEDLRKAAALVEAHARGASRRP